MQNEKTEFYLYRFVVTNPLPEVIDILPELGVQILKEQQGTLYLCSSFITHKQAEAITRRTGIVATSYKRVKGMEVAQND